MGDYFLRVRDSVSQSVLGGDKDSNNNREYWRVRMAWKAVNKGNYKSSQEVFWTICELFYTSNYFSSSSSTSTNSSLLHSLTSNRML